MFDITKTREIYYGEDQSVILFQDHTKHDTWYMVPVPKLRMIDGSPAFSLTKYLSPTGDAAGICTFQVDLHFPEEARRAAEQQIGGQIAWGQFTWVGGETYLTFELEGDVEMISVSPSLFGNNVAAYQIELKSEAEIKTFINAFTGNGNLSSFQIEYEMVALTELLGARATIEYNSTAAIEYEKKYENRTDIWGNSKQVLTEIKQILKRSNAGTVNVERGVGATDETIQRVRDWAWSTLEQEVTSNIETARQMATGPNPVSASTSFTRSYEENAIIEWTTPVSSYLPKFSDDIWQKVYREVDNRELAVTFGLMGNLFDESGNASFENVTVTVDYPTRQQNNTFVLIPGDDNKAAYTYIAPGHQVNGKFDPQFRYKYRVNYFSGAPYESDWTITTETRIDLRPSDFGLSQVFFIGSNVPFESAGISGSDDEIVSKVFIDFFFMRPKGKDSLVQSKTMTQNGIENQVSFTSTFNAPVGQEYSYRLRYLMKSGLVITTQPESKFGGNNADVVNVLSPLDLITIFNLRAYNMDAAANSAFDLIEVTGQYYDAQNDGDRPISRNTWSWTPDPNNKLDTAEAWRFQTTPNPDTAYFKLAGQVLYSDGEDFQLDNYFLPANRSSLVLYSDSYFYSVRVETSRIDWTTVSAVYLNLFQYEATGQVNIDILASLPSYYLRPSALLTEKQRQDVEEKRVNVQRFDLISPAEGERSVDNFTRYYNIRRRKTEKQVVFLYNADYIMKNGEIKTIKNDVVKDKLQISLPPIPDGGAEARMLVRVIQAEDLPSAKKARQPKYAKEKAPV